MVNIQCVKVVYRVDIGRGIDVSAKQGHTGTQVRHYPVCSNSASLAIVGQVMDGYYTLLARAAAVSTTT
eukprot:1160803-Pelagomonas_calceolata.AAC.2